MRQICLLVGLKGIVQILVTRRCGLTRRSVGKHTLAHVVYVLCCDVEMTLNKLKLAVLGGEFDEMLAQQVGVVKRSVK